MPSPACEKLGNVFRDLVIIQWWFLNQTVNIKIMGRAEPIVRWPSTSSFFDLKEPLDESLDLRSLNASGSDERTSDSLETGAYCDLLSRFPSLLPSEDVGRVRWLLVFRWAVQSLFVPQRPSPEYASDSVRERGVTTPLSTFTIADPTLAGI